MGFVAGQGDEDVAIGVAADGAGELDVRGGEEMIEVFAAEFLAPELGGLSEVLGIREGVAVGDEAVLAGEVKFLRGEQVGDAGGALVGAVHEADEDDPAGAEVMVLEGEDIEVGAVGAEFVDVGLEEVEVKVRSSMSR